MVCIKVFVSIDFENQDLVIIMMVFVILICPYNFRFVRVQLADQVFIIDDPGAMWLSIR